MQIQQQLTVQVIASKVMEIKQYFDEAQIDETNKK